MGGAVIPAYHVDPGSLSTLFVYQERTSWKDPDGGVVESLADRFDVRGGLRSLKGYEVFRARSIESDVTHEVVVRFRRDVKAKGALRFKAGADEGRILEIESVRDPDGSRRWLLLGCFEIPPIPLP